MRIRAFSYATYAWSLPVTWQRWRSHHSIRHSRKPHDTRKFHGCMFRTYCRSNFYLAGINIFFTFLLLWPWPWLDDLHIRTWPVFPPDISDIRIWTSYVKAFESCRLTTDRQTDRQNRNYIPYSPLRWWSKILISFRFIRLGLCLSRIQVRISAFARTVNVATFDSAMIYHLSLLYPTSKPESDWVLREVRRIEMPSVVRLPNTLFVSDPEVTRNRLLLSKVRQTSIDKTITICLKREYLLQPWRRRYASVLDVLDALN